MKIEWLEGLMVGGKQHKTDDDVRAGGYGLGGAKVGGWCWGDSGEGW